MLAQLTEIAKSPILLYLPNIEDMIATFEMLGTKTLQGKNIRDSNCMSVSSFDGLCVFNI